MPASPVSNMTWPMPSYGTLPAFNQQANLLLSTYQQCQASCSRHVETCLRPAVVQDPVYHEGLGYVSFEGLGT